MMASQSTWRGRNDDPPHDQHLNLTLSYIKYFLLFSDILTEPSITILNEQQHKPELLPEVGSEVLCQLVVVLQAGQQEATAPEQQNGLSRTQNRLLQV